MSDQWITSEDGSYCSVECTKAKFSEMSWIAYCMTIMLVPLLIGIWFTNSSYVELQSMKDEIMLTGSVLLIVMIALSLYLRTQEKFAQKIPKNSRRDIGISEVSLLRRISDPIECPNCDGKITMSEIGDDLVYSCQYCGANGVVEIQISE